MSNEYEQRANPLTAFLHEQAMKAEREREEKEMAELKHKTEIMDGEENPSE